MPLHNPPYRSQSYTVSWKFRHGMKALEWLEQSLRCTLIETAAIVANKINYAIIGNFLAKLNAATLMVGRIFPCVPQQIIHGDA